MPKTTDRIAALAAHAEERPGFQVSYSPEEGQLYIREGWVFDSSEEYAKSVAFLVNWNVETGKINRINRVRGEKVSSVRNLTSVERWTGLRPEHRDAARNRRAFAALAALVDGREDFEVKSNSIERVSYGLENGWLAVEIELHDDGKMVAREYGELAPYLHDEDGRFIGLGEEKSYRRKLSVSEAVALLGDGEVDY